jgi:predicted Zn finger-like uncharacterized protein
MILTCPSCSARYFAADDSIGPNGRSVRCAGCQHTWFVEPQLELSEPAEGARAEPALTREQVERMRRAAAPVAQSSASRFRQQQAEKVRLERFRAAAMAWTATGVALAATTGTALAFREDVSRIWPKAASAYAAVGMDVNIFGLEFADLSVEHVYDGDAPALIVRGKVTNIGGEERKAPALRFGLRDAEEQEVQHVVARLDDHVIPAGGALPFEVRIEKASDLATDLEATFASGREAEHSDFRARSAAAGEARYIQDAPLALDQPAPTDFGMNALDIGGPIDDLAPRSAWPDAASQTDVHG